ncbi:glycoside hydrolase superfamily [Xylariales sp. PMI_506]|nr:glycoside hydrolase superfamily [Xylariales sp. PMI_506]
MALRIFSSIIAVSTLLWLATPGLAGFSASSQDNVAVYWGQNSVGLASSQLRLSDYCSNTELNVIPIAFASGISNSNPSVNFASATDICDHIAESGLVQCPEIEQDIITCQSQYGKTILLSLGGAVDYETGFADDIAVEAAASKIWGLFGPTSVSVPAADRPFGSAVVDGFDFDFEAPVQGLPDFAHTLRQLMDADTSKKYYLSAAPQCPFPDANVGTTLDAVPFDLVMVQFYNNPQCGVSTFASADSPAAGAGGFNFATWDNWAKTASPNKDVKVLLGVPASQSAANGGSYVSAAQIASAIAYSKQFSSFGGVMMWDMSQLFANAGFLDSVSAALGGAAPGVGGGGGGGGSGSGSGNSFAPPGPVIATYPPIGESTTLATVTRPFNPPGVKLKNAKLRITTSTVCASSTALPGSQSPSPSSPPTTSIPITDLPPSSPAPPPPSSSSVATGPLVPEWGQ